MKRRGFLPALLVPAASSLLPKIGGGVAGGDRASNDHKTLLTELQALKDKVAALEVAAEARQIKDLLDQGPISRDMAARQLGMPDAETAPWLSGYRRQQIAMYGFASRAAWPMVAVASTDTPGFVSYDLAPMPVLAMPKLTPLTRVQRNSSLPRLKNLDPMPIASPTPVVPPTPDPFANVPPLHPPRRR